MKTRIVLILFCAATLLAIASAVVIARKSHPIAAGIPGEQTFDVKGIVRGLESDGKTVNVEHEEIPDYMPAMTMPLEVKEPRLLQNLQVGDSIEFQLVVTEDDSWISRIKRLEAGWQSAAATTKSSATRDIVKTEIGEVVPNFSLTNQNGQLVSLHDFRGKAVLMTFIFTRCPIPNFCPLLSKNFADLQQRLSKEFPGRFQLMSVTFDPQFDTPEVLKSYSSHWSRDESNWAFATGSPDQIAGVAESFGAFYETQGATINHDLRTALISPEGKLVHVWKSNVWTTYEVHRMVRETLTGARDIASRPESLRKN